MIDQVFSRDYVGFTLAVAFALTFAVFMVARVVVPVIETWVRRNREGEIADTLRREGVKSRHSRYGADADHRLRKGDA